MDPHPWRSAPTYRVELCPMCSSPHYPFCPPPPPFNGAHFLPPYPYLSPPPPPPPLASWPHPPVPPPVDLPDIREGSRKRMRVEDPFDPYGASNRVVSKDEKVLNLIKNHGRSNEFQYSNLGSYQNHQMQSIGYNYNNNNPYNNPYPVSQSISQSYRPTNYGYSASNRVGNGYGYRPNPVRPVLPPPPPTNAPGQLSGLGRLSNPSPLPQREGQNTIYPSLSKPSKRDEREANSIRNTTISGAIKINACNLFKAPHRASRPDHFVIILRGLAGSGKSYIAKALRDIEVENGGDAPRIHSMDDYFMIEVEKNIEESDGLNLKSRGKKLTKKVIEYCYEAEMEETYRSSMLKAFKKTLDEGKFTFIIVDDRNLRVADFSQFWAIAKRSGYEVYLLEAPYKDPMGCVARNVHGFTLDEIKKMAAKWEEAPPLYLQLDVQPLLRGDDLKEESIKEVDMDLEDDFAQPTHHVSNNPNIYTNSNINNIYDEPKSPDNKPHAAERSDSEDEETVGVKDLRQSKWSKNIEDERENLEASRGNTISLSDLIKAYKTSRKSVHWGDWANKGGFSIGSSAKNRTNLSLIIGPGSGYNLKSNPLIEEENKSPSTRGRGNNNSETKRLFSEQLRAESESFKAVFDRRQHRIGGLNSGADNE